MDQTPNLFLSVGKQVKDEYGHPIGKIASFALTPAGKFDSVFIEQGDGKFQKHPVDNLTFDETEVLFVSQIKARATILYDQIPLIWRKDQALKDLSEKKKISREMYGELHTNFDGLLTQLKTEAQALTEDIDNEVAKCTDEIKALNYAFVHLELEHEIGKMDNQTYETAFAIVQENLKRAHMMKTDLELTRSKLSNILLGDPAKTKMSEGSRAPSSVSFSPGLPEPPVVVYVKEIGKTGI